MLRPKKISIVTPFYNEEAGLSFFYDALVEVFSRMPDYDFEVVCVDDGSRDATLARLIALAERDVRFVVLELSRNFGKEAALTAGIDAASGDAVVPMDADLQDPPELISAMVDKWVEGFDVVLARRSDRSSDGFLKRKTAELFYKLHNSLADISIPGNVGDFRLMDRIVVEALQRLPEQQRFMKGLFAWVGFRTAVIDYVRTPRVAGSTKFSGWRLWNFALDGITSFSAAPLKLWTYVGAVGALLSAIYALLVIHRTVWYGVEVPGYASTLCAVLFIGSLQLVSVGMLGEYVGRIYLEAKGRPVYLVRKRYGGEE